MSAPVSPSLQNRRLAAVVYLGSYKPMSASPPAYKEWYEKKFLPAGRKAGLPE